VFTGIVERSLPLLDALPVPSGLRLTLPNAWKDVKHGESIAVNGVCLTVAELSDELLWFDVIRETLNRTNLGHLRPGDEVHVERSLRVGDRFDGHMVQGHVDGTANIREHETTNGEWRVRIDMPRELARYFVPKGSVTLDGISLTIAGLDADTFEVALIPTTLEITRLGQRPVGWPLNVECDMMVKTIVSVLEKFGVGSVESGGASVSPHSTLPTPHST
jgi:riboflavin synthase